MTAEEVEHLEHRRDAVEASIDGLGNRLVAFIVVVVIGLGIELYRPIIFLAKKFDLSVLIELIGTALVTLGVAGELFVEWKAHRKEQELRGINARIESADKTRIADLNLKAEQERHARVELQKTLTGRSITPEQQANISASLLRFAGQRFRVTRDTENFEQMNFANLINFALSSAKWSREKLQSEVKPANFITEGVIVQATGDTKSQEAGKALARSLLACGHAVHFDSSPAEAWLFRDGTTGKNTAERVWVAVTDSPRPCPFRATNRKSNRTSTGRRGITADTALRLVRYFNTTPPVLAQPPGIL